MLEFEVVADTLWMFSFIMEGLETYMKEKELITNYHRYQNMHERVIQDISREQGIFHSSCQAFMELISDGCGLTEDDISAMLHGPNHYYWQDENISLALKGGGRNSSSFGAYLEIVDSIKDHLEYVQALADLHEDALPDTLPKEYLRLHIRGFLEALEKGEVSEHLTNISQFNIRLTQLIQQ